WSWDSNGPRGHIYTGWRLNTVSLSFPVLLVPVQLQDNCNGGSCHPNLGDLMVGRAAQLSATSTCGMNGPQNYCILGYLEDEQKCFNCDSRSPYDRHNNHHSHRIENIITTFEPERKMKWWQSENGVQRVSIRLDLKTVFQFSHLVLTFKSFRPAAMLVERSKDFGRTWKVFRYFSADCANDFPGVSQGPAESIDDLICDSRYSGSEPSTDGELVLKALDPNFHIYDPYDPTIQGLHFLLFFLRLKKSNNEVIDCLSDIFLQLQQDYIYRQCNCNGHSERCHFDLNRYMATGQVSGGVCEDCRNNRIGAQCEQCQPGYYRDPQRPIEDPAACIPCACHSAGSVDGGLCDPVSGRCVCKQNVEGERCDRCISGFFGLSQGDNSGCQRCRCNSLGSKSTSPCDQTTGQCICEDFAHGPECDQCVAGYWGLGNTVYGCLPCDCDVGGAFSTVCLSVSGQCQCRANMIGLSCSEPAPGYFLAPLDFYLYEAENAAPLETKCSYYLVDVTVTWTGPGFVRVQNGAGLRFAVTNIPLNLNYHFVIRYEAEVCISTLDTPVCLSSGVRYYVDITFERQSTPDPYCRSHILIDSMCFLIHTVSVCFSLACKCNPEGSFSSSCSKFGGQCDCKPNVIGRCCDTCAPLTYGFGPNGCSACNCEPSGSKAEVCDHRTGQCPCRNEVTGQRCDRCLPGYFGFPNCKRCQCNGLADLCDPVTGLCLNCKEHSTGPHCERCVEGYFGDPVSRETCLPCRCPDVKGSGRFFARSCTKDPNALVPTCECEEGHQGFQCDSCAPGYYGNLLLPGARCTECPCNNNIDPGDGEACDAVSGECLHCLHNTHGPNCQTCKPGYYGNALLQDCRECTCDRLGAELTRCPPDGPCFCDAVTGQCPCRAGVVGVLCDQCEDGYWNLHSGCVPCNCNSQHSLSKLCDKITGQCSCEREYGGKQCDQCAENHFGNPDIQCISCDCNMEGTVFPGCDPYTGECMCRPGVSGIFCDECSPGHNPAFPACEPCHACSLLWEKKVTDITKAVAEMASLPRPPNVNDVRLQKWMQELEEKLNNLVNMLGRDQNELGAIEKLMNLIRYCKISMFMFLFSILYFRNMIETIDPHTIIIDPSQLLNNEIGNIHQEFKRLLEGLKRKLEDGPKLDLKALNGRSAKKKNILKFKHLKHIILLNTLCCLYFRHPGEDQKAPC
uniref:Laminin, beta 4 n=1 Tax=Astyanax mexicanus TaxID=7994 RepID=A0A8B9LTS4_ASTMX